MQLRGLAQGQGKSCSLLLSVTRRYVVLLVHVTRSTNTRVYLYDCAESEKQGITAFLPENLFPSSHSGIGTFRLTLPGGGGRWF